MGNRSSEGTSRSHSEVGRGQAVSHGESSGPLDLKVTFDEILDGIGHGPGPDPAISIRQMSFRYPNGVQALDRVNLHVSRGATL